MSCFLKKMRNTIFQDPAVFQDADNWGIFVGWVPSPRYLCGNLPHKLKLVQEIQQRFPSKFEINVIALERRLPQRQTINQIHISLGSPWVPAEKYSQFVKELLQLSKRVPVYLSPELAKWKIEIAPSVIHPPMALWLCRHRRSSTPPTSQNGQRLASACAKSRSQTCAVLQKPHRHRSKK